MFRHQRRQESIFTRGEQVLVKCVDVRFCIFVNDLIRDDDGTTLVCGSNTVK
jgi:hypothetical protein